MVDKGAPSKVGSEAQFVPQNPAADRAEGVARGFADAILGEISPRTAPERRGRHAEAVEKLAAFALEAVRASLTDSLTGLPNSSALELDLIHFGIHGHIQDKIEAVEGSVEGEVIESDIQGEDIGDDERALDKERRASGPLTVLYMDCDNFKAGNDSLGHDVMDQFFKELVLGLSVLFREGDVLYRVGGDELVCLMPNGMDAQTSREFNERLGVLMESLFGKYPYLRTIGFGISRGVMTFDPRIHKDFPAIKRAAELAMYDEKSKKRDARGDSR